MGSSIAPAKVRAVSWDGLEKVELFTEAVKQQLAALKVQRRVTVGPKVPLPEATLDRVIMCLWCVCYCGMPWRAACRLADLPFGTVYSCFARWGRLGLWKVVLLDLLRRWRVACGDNPAPSVVLVDSRSCRSAPTCGQRGIDGGKTVKGVTINLVVDKPGFPLAVSLAKANVHDTLAIVPARRGAAADGFRGKALGDLSYPGDKLRATGRSLGIEVETKAGGAKGTFIPTGLRWVVERSFAWLSRYRRLNTIFDRTNDSLIAFVYIAFISILACRLSRLQTAEIRA
jgi:transposase